MKRSLKYKMAKATASNYKLNKKAMQLKRSWDEVEGILSGSMKKRKR
ncbi:MAG: hypothetical protein GX319_08065 [Clostridiales bacterium]|jgi:hypothetical protein|nr:hypothetical protein [Bacillota bacterium]NLK04347.1 hypothetical protein [Clostridiales bacterium]